MNHIPGHPNAQSENPVIDQLEKLLEYQRQTVAEQGELFETQAKLVADSIKVVKLWSTSYFATRVNDLSDKLADERTEFLHFKQDTNHTLDEMRKAFGSMQNKIKRLENDNLSLTKELRNSKGIGSNE